MNSNVCTDLEFHFLVINLTDEEKQIVRIQKQQNTTKNPPDKSMKIQNNSEKSKKLSYSKPKNQTKSKIQKSKGETSCV